MSSSARVVIAAVASGETMSAKPQELAMLAWSFARLAFTDLPLIDAISASSIRMILDFDPQSLANLAWADATFSVSNEPLLHSISSPAVAKHSE